MTINTKYVFLKGNKDLGFTKDSGTMKNSNMAFLCILQRVTCCFFLPRCQLLMIQDTDTVSQTDFRECGTRKNRLSSNVMSRTERRHCEILQHEFPKAPWQGAGWAKRPGANRPRNGLSTAPLKAVTSGWAPTGLSGQSPLRGQASVLGTKLI